MTDYERIASGFTANVQAVLQLADLDRGLLDNAIKEIEKRDERLRTSNVVNANMLAGGTLASLRNIRQNDSLRPGFQQLVNQSVVLLVSYFASAISELFRAAVGFALQSKTPKELVSLQLKLSVAELASHEGDLLAVLPELVEEAVGVSFQDTGSISRVFAKYLELDVPQDLVTNNVAVGLAFRHVLVHNGGVVSRRCIKQVGGLKPREIRLKVALDEQLNFESAEVEQLADSMVKYLKRLCDRARDNSGC